MFVFEGKKKYRLCYDQNNWYIFTFIVNPIDFQFFSHKFRRALLDNPVPLIFITDSDRAISTL